MKREIMMPGFALMVGALCSGCVVGSDEELAEEGMISPGTEEAASEALSDRLPNVLARIDLGQGYVEFVEHPDGMIGAATMGGPALSAVDRLMQDHEATMLEVYLALGGPERAVPAALRADHERHAHDNPRVGVEPRRLAGMAAAKDGGQTRKVSEGFVDGSACGDRDLRLWNYWFNTYKNYDDWGAQGQSGTGEWDGDANINLGSTSAGVMAMCDVDDDLSTSASVRVEEYYGGLGWVTLWYKSHVYEPFAYGYRFSGFGIHKMRMKVRNFEDGTLFWGASY